MAVRFAKKSELDRVNVLRKQVNDLHVQGKPEVFKPGFSRELRDHIFTVWEDPRREIVVCERGGVICGYAFLRFADKPETPYTYGRSFLEIEEFGADEAYRRTGVATEMIGFIRAYAKDKGVRKIELNMWEFNQDALAFYEKAGFSTYRRYMETDV